jgi:NADPH-dependent 2,4-dienoyl-CoA reductase/sulfur reductase-like enzyme
MTLTTCTTLGALAPDYDLIIVGAGPAGLAAALEAAPAGVSVLVLDQHPGPGGQMYPALTRNAPEAFSFLGPDYWRGAVLVEAFQACPVQYAPRATVWSLQPGTDGPDPGLEVGVSQGGEARQLRARQVILASGAQERPMPIPGWTLPGVMLAGAGQIALKSAGLVPQGNVVLAGCGPMLYLLAGQLLDAGFTPSAILDTTRPGQWLRALPRLPGLLASAYVWKGLKLLLKVRTSVPFIRGVKALEALGAGRVERLRFRTGGRWRELPADLVLLHQGVVPEVSLSGAAGCALEWNPRQRAFQPRLDGSGRTSVPGVSVAGDGGTVAGALLAEVTGRLSAISVLAALGALDPARQAERERPLVRELRRLRRGRPFLDLLYQSREAFRIPADDSTIVCRCEEVRAGEVRSAIALGAPGPNQLKAFLRCGMGPCQGRLCALTVTEMMAAQRRVDPGEVGIFRARIPVKPITLGEMASLPATPEALVVVTGAATPLKAGG